VGLIKYEVDSQLD